MRGRIFFLVSAVVLCACGNNDFANDDGDSGEVGPGGGGDGGGDGGVEAGAPTPVHAPAAVAFVDQDPAALKVQGTVKISKATDESDVTSYVLYWSADGTTKMGGAITTLAKTGGDLTYPFAAGTTASANANTILAFTSNDHGENPAAVSTAGDNYARFNDTSALTFPANGGSPISLFYEASTKNFGTLSLSETFLCPASGAACTQHPTAFSTTNSPAIVDSVFDAASSKVIGFMSSLTTSSLAICGADGSGCTTAPLDASLTGVSDASLVIDDVGGNLYVAAKSGSSTITKCMHDGTACALHQVTDNGGATETFGSYKMAVDRANSRLVVAVEDFTDNRTPAVLLCPLAFGATDACIYKSLGADTDSGHNPSIVIDAAGGKILVVTNYETGSAFTPALYRCDLSGDNCARVDLAASSGLGSGSGEFPCAAIDAIGGHLYVAVYSSDTNTTSLLRCNIDGTACSATALLPTVAATGGPASIRLDAATGKIFFDYPVIPGGTSAVYGSIAVW